MKQAENGRRACPRCKSELIAGMAYLRPADKPGNDENVRYVRLYYDEIRPELPKFHCKVCGLDFNESDRFEVSCEKCGSAECIPIVWGEPSDEQAAAAQAGKIKLGGDLMRNEYPNWYCKKCRHQWSQT